MLTKCVQCKFNIQAKDEVCINCGISHPAKPFENSLFSNDKFFSHFLVPFFILAIGSITYLINSLFTVFILIKILSSILIGLTLGIFSAGFLKYYFVGKKLKESQKKRQINSSTSFIFQEKIISKRIQELGARENQIDLTISRISENSSEELKTTQRKLLEVRKIVTGQVVQYELQKYKIELVRLQNRLLPYIYNIHRLKDFETENGIIETENVVQEMNRFKKDLWYYEGVQFSARVLNEKSDFYAQLQDTENSCIKLREVLLTKQATRALIELNSNGDLVKLPSSKELIRESSVFNIQTNLTDFSETFEELERAYKILKTENELNESIFN